MEGRLFACPYRMQNGYASTYKKSDIALVNSSIYDILYL